ncbi:MAG: SUMF1/EgtB/PvdO family nonheme iron enzyme [Anaerolineae bacterium]
MRIFISYSRVDRNLCVDLANRLRRVYGYESVWFDETLHAGEVWWQEILDQVRRCDIFLIMMTRETFESEYCQAEYKEATRLKKLLLPMLVRARIEIPDHLKHIQYVDIAQGINADNLGELYAAIEQLQKRLGSKPADPVSAEPTPKPEVKSTIGYTAELTRARTLSRGAFIVGGLGFFALAAALIFIFVAMNSTASAAGELSPPQQTQLAMLNSTQIAQLPTSTETPTITMTSTATATDTESPTPTVTVTPSATPTDTATPTPINVDQAVETLVAQGHTATAAQWTATPTEDRTATIIARLTERVLLTQTQDAANLTATATLWTATPTETPTPTATPTNTATPTVTLTPTITPTATPTLTDQERAETLAVSGVTANSEWTPYMQLFDGVAMMLVPQGCFTMGFLNGTGDERPTSDQCIEQPFWIDLTEVTNAAYGSTGLFVGANRPRDRVTFIEARDFCEARGGRLPTEREWEYAARGPDNLLYPWGDDFVADNAIFGGDEKSATGEVGSLPAGRSWVGAMDMAGNLSEWVDSVFLNYPYDPTDGREFNRNQQLQRVLRGGAWTATTATELRASYRDHISPDSVFRYIGFRCARDFIPAAGN